MKLPFKPIAILVIVSLVGIFAYQAYWLTGLYRTMKTDMEQNIVEAMRISDYNEMMLRVNALRKDSREHGEVSVSAGYHDDGASFVRSSTTIHKTDSAEQYNDSIKMVTVVKTDTLETDSDGISSLHSTNGLDLILRDKNTMAELTTYFQRGLHSGLDILMDPNISIYDSLLTIQLAERGIHLPHRLEHLHKGTIALSEQTFVDTLTVLSSTGYVPTHKAQQYEYAFDINTNQSYRLTIEPINRVVLQQMSGILATSFIILVILGFSFWFLIRTILRQKTLEEMKSDFTNNITHELKTPIAVAYAANDALLNFNQAEDKSKRDNYLRICQEQLQQLSGMVEQILSMSMESRKTFQLQPEILALQDILPPLIDQHKLKAKKEVCFNLDIDPKELTITADHAHFSNIISNLIDNAIKYSPDQAYVDIRCSVSEVEGNKYVLISVTDRGIGIPADKQTLVFDKFYRVPTGNLYNTQGYGLGLFYVKTMVEKHGGIISVKSEPGKGSCFTIRMDR